MTEPQHSPIPAVERRVEKHEGPATSPAPLPTVYRLPHYSVPLRPAVTNR